MYQIIHEQIEVAGVYNHLKFTPKKFKWKNKVYSIKEITLTAEMKDGGVKKRFFSVVSQGEVYRVIFDRENEKWWLEEKWVE